jgi:hypothetical protein
MTHSHKSLIALLVGLFCLGCSSGSTPEAALRNANRTNIQRLANFYSMYQVQNQFRGPADESTFKSFLAGVSSDVMESMGVKAADLEKLFINERDNEPFLIKYGVASSPRGSKEPVVFEAKGKGGKRMVGFLNMVQREVEDQEYEQLWNSNVASTAPARESRELGQFP